MRPAMIALAAVGLAACLAPLFNREAVGKREAVGRANASVADPVALLTPAPPPSTAMSSPMLPSAALMTAASVSDAPAALVGRASSPGPGGPAEVEGPFDLSGLDLTRIGLSDDGATAPLDRGRIARLTVDPVLQSAAWASMASRHIPEASVVLLDAQSGAVLVYASHQEEGPARDLLAEARAPAASVFKIITASALVDDAGLGPETRQCYGGGEERIVASDLVDNPARDRWCVTLGGAMGRSVNAVFARLASKHLDRAMLERAAEHLGFGQSVPFDVKVEPSTLHIPEGELGFARTAAGFWNSTLSPVHAAWMSAAIERGGEPVRPFIVRAIVGEHGGVVDSPARSTTHAPLLRSTTAAALTSMMEHTVAEGTSYRAFHDARRAPFLPGLTVAGKTGTLTDDHAQRYYTWFTGFAPSHPVPGVRPVAVAALVVNGPSWRVKANVVAREALQAYFAETKTKGVLRPRGASIAEDSGD